ncbi:hypothetical protein ACU686_17905 [Yinghuangia aomiensis]
MKQVTPVQGTMQWRVDKRRAVVDRASELHEAEEPGVEGPQAAVPARWRIGPKRHRAGGMLLDSGLTGAAAATLSTGAVGGVGKRKVLGEARSGPSRTDGSEMQAS